MFCDIDDGVRKYGLVSFLSAGAVFSPTTVAKGIVIEERAQPAGMCQQSNSSAHVFVMQSSPVKRVLQAWEGKRRLGRMAPGNLSVLPAGLPMSWQWDGPVQSLHVSVSAHVADALANDERPLELPAPFLFEDALVQLNFPRFPGDSAIWIRRLRVGG